MTCFGAILLGLLAILPERVNAAAPSSVSDSATPTIVPAANTPLVIQTIDPRIHDAERAADKAEIALQLERNNDSHFVNLFSWLATVWAIFLTLLIVGLTFKFRSEVIDAATNAAQKAIADDSATVAEFLANARAAAAEAERALSEIRSHQEEAISIVRDMKPEAEQAPSASERDKVEQVAAEARGKQASERKPEEWRALVLQAYYQKNFDSALREARAMDYLLSASSPVDAAWALFSIAMVSTGAQN